MIGLLKAPRRRSEDMYPPMLRIVSPKRPGGPVSVPAHVAPVRADNSGPMPKDQKITRVIIFPGRGLFRFDRTRRERTARVRSDRFWQERAITKCGRIVYSFVDFRAAERLTRIAAGLEPVGEA